MNSDWRSAELPDGVTHRLLLVRHGETQESARGLCYGKLDVALCAAGLQQVQHTADLIRPFKPSAIYSSPRQRATDTAAAVSRECQLDTTVEENLAELDFGEFEGLKYEEAERHYPDIYKQWMHQPTKVHFPNGESYDQMATRVLQSISRLNAKHQNQSIVVISHGGVNRIVLAKVLKLESEQIFRLDQSYGAISCIDYYEQTPLVRVMNWLP